MQTTQLGTLRAWLQDHLAGGYVLSIAIDPEWVLLRPPRRQGATVLLTVGAADGPAIALVASKLGQRAKLAHGGVAWSVSIRHAPVRVLLTEAD